MMTKDSVIHQSLTYWNELYIHTMNFSRIIVLYCKAISKALGCFNDVWQGFEKSHRFLTHRGCSRMIWRLGGCWSLDHRARNKVQIDSRVMILRESCVVTLPTCSGARSRMEADRDSA